MSDPTEPQDIGEMRPCETCESNDNCNVRGYEDEIHRLKFSLSQEQARSRRYRELLDHLVHLNRGINKGGYTPLPSDWNDAWTEAEAALADEAGV